MKHWHIKIVTKCVNRRYNFTLLPVYELKRERKFGNIPHALTHFILRANIIVTNADNNVCLLIYSDEGEFYKVKSWIILLTVENNYKIY